MQRFKGNPILTAADLPANTGYFILNPGAVKFNGEYLLLVDVFHVEGGIIFWIARSRDGYRFRFDPKPVDWPRRRPGGMRTAFMIRASRRSGTNISSATAATTTRSAPGSPSRKHATSNHSSSFRSVRRSTTATARCFRRRSTVSTAGSTGRSAAASSRRATCG